MIWEEWIKNFKLECNKYNYYGPIDEQSFVWDYEDKIDYKTAVKQFFNDINYVPINKMGYGEYFNIFKKACEKDFYQDIIVKNDKEIMFFYEYGLDVIFAAKFYVYNKRN